MKKLLITGGSGYLGSHLLKAARDDWEVRATYWHNRCERGVQLDVRDAVAVKRLVGEFAPEVIIHTAYSMSVPEEEMMRINAEGTRHVARAAAQIGARLIHISSDVIFAGEKGGYTEADAPQPVHAYGRSKAAAEQEVRAHTEDAVIVRTSLITGFAPLDSRSAWVLNSVRERKPITLFTDEYRCPVWVRDLTSALLELAQMDFRGVIHIAGAQRVSRYELGVKLARAHGLDETWITPGLAAECGKPRPRDCTLDISLARRLLSTRLAGVDEMLERLTTNNTFAST